MTMATILLKLSICRIPTALARSAPITEIVNRFIATFAVDYYIYYNSRNDIIFTVAVQDILPAEKIVIKIWLSECSGR